MPTKPALAPIVIHLATSRLVPASDVLREPSAAFPDSASPIMALSFIASATVNDHGKRSSVSKVAPGQPKVSLPTRICALPTRGNGVSLNPAGTGPTWEYPAFLLEFGEM